MNFPLDLRFKIIAVAPQATVTDAGGHTVCYFKQKVLRLREKVEVYSDAQRSTLIATISANKILDWSARYTFHDAAGNEIGSVGRRGARSIWRAHYDIFKPGDTTADFEIREESPWTKVFDSILGDIPILGFFTGFMLHPAYMASRADGTPAIRLQKQAAFLEGKFALTKHTDLSADEELIILLSFLMVNLLERNRG